jgi:hypothetical protein
MSGHLHRHSEELFHMQGGGRELLAFEPPVRTSEPGSWRGWQPASGARVARLGPGIVVHREVGGLVTA